jgi:HK97 family phage portal protein
MSWLGKLFGRSIGTAGGDPAATNGLVSGAPPPASPPPGVTGMPSWSTQWPPPYGGRYLPENLSTVLACVQAIAGGIAALPMAVYRRSNGNRVELPNHPVARLIKAPNALQTGPDFIEWLIASMLLQGNAIAVVDHDGAGRPNGLFPIPFWTCQPILVPAASAEAIGSPIVPNSKLVFDVTMTMMPWPLPGPRPANGYPIRYFADEVVFLKDRSDDGILGRSRLSRCPEVLACGLGAQGFSSGIWRNGAVVGGVIQHPGRLSAEASANIAESWKQTHSGGENAGRTAILEEGMSYTRVGISPEDAQLLESRLFSVLELSRVFGVPPPIIGEWSHATFSNTASAREWFAALTLLPIVNKLEKEFSRVVINDDDVTLCVDMSGMLRGDFPQLVSSYVQLVRSGIASADEARLAVGLDPRGGDADSLMPQAIGGRPGQTPDGAGDQLPQPGNNLNGSGRPNGAGVQ